MAGTGPDAQLEGRRCHEGTGEGQAQAAPINSDNIRGSCGGALAHGEQEDIVLTAVRVGCLPERARPVVRHGRCISVLMAKVHLEVGGDVPGFDHCTGLVARLPSPSQSRVNEMAAATGWPYHR